MGTSEDVERIAAPVLNEAGLELIDVELRSGNIVVTVDREGGIDLDTLAAASRAISAAIDREDVGPSGRYELEVSSPGLERRLRRPEHFRHFVGHQVAIRTMPGAEGERRFEGEITAADGRGVVVSGTGLPEGGRRLAYDDIERAHTVFDWRAALARTPSPTARSDRRRQAKSSSAPGGRERVEKEMADKL
ncbi:MAG: ribosome maturation factor RimP [Acidimicrobiales bacterium]|jgi:ribosome maturation factor RimP